MPHLSLVVPFIGWDSALTEYTYRVYSRVRLKARDARLGKYMFISMQSSVRVHPGPIFKMSAHVYHRKAGVLNWFESRDRDVKLLPGDYWKLFSSFVPYRLPALPTSRQLEKGKQWLII